MEHPRSVLFVCLGNICRSPLAEGIFRSVADEQDKPTIRIDSAATSNWNVGAPPDDRAIAVARRNGIDISNQRARQIRRKDFEEFDLILGMDRRNVTDLRNLTDRGDAQLALFLEHAGGPNADIPDPYTGTADDFETVFRTIEQATRKLITVF